MQNDVLLRSQLYKQNLAYEGDREMYKGDCGIKGGPVF